MTAATDNPKVKSLARSVIEKVVAALVLALIITMITVWADVQKLKTFAGEGDRFTEDDFNEYKIEERLYRGEVKEVLEDIKEDSQTNKETLIRLETLMTQMSGSLPDARPNYATSDS